MPPEDGATVDEDVTTEESHMRELMQKRLNDDGSTQFAGTNGPYALEAYGLRKVFKSRGGCCRWGSGLEGREGGGGAGNDGVTFIIQC